MKRTVILGVVALVLLTGCLHGGNGAENGLENGEEATVAVAVGMSAEAQQEIQAEQQQAQQEFMEDLNETEQELLQQAQFGQVAEEDQALVDDLMAQMEEAGADAEALAEDAQQEALDDLDAAVQGSDTLEEIDRLDVQGETLVLLSGNANELIGLLGQPGVHALLDQQQYDQLAEQMAMQEEGFPGGEMPEEEIPEEEIPEEEVEEIEIE